MTAPVTPLAITRLEDRLTPASPVPGPADLIASGAGAGAPPVVQLYRPDGTIRSQFAAYDTGFTGGVSVAMADVNADGVADVVTAAGAGGGPHVKVFDGKSLDRLFDPTQPSPAVVVEPVELYSFFAYDPGFTGGVSVAAADVDGDGYADVVTGAGPGGGPHVKAFSGKTGAEVFSFFAFEGGYRAGVNVAAGRLREEPAGVAEHADILVGTGAGVQATVAGFDGRTGETLFAHTPYGSFGGGVYVTAADVTGDGFDDVITGAGAGGGPHVLAFDGWTLGHLPVVLLPPGGVQPIRSFFAFDPAFGGGVRVAAADLNGDTRNDIVAAAGPGGAPTLRAFSGVDGRELFRTDKFGYTPGTPGYAAGATVGGKPNATRPVPVLE